MPEATAEQIDRVRTLCDYDYGDLSAYERIALRSVLTELERLREDVARLTAKAAYLEHDGECCGGCPECSRLYAEWQASEEVQS